MSIHSTIIPSLIPPLMTPRFRTFRAFPMFAIFAEVAIVDPSFILSILAVMADPLADVAHVVVVNLCWMIAR